MIDPNIALSYRSPQIQDPLEVQARQMSLKNMGLQQQLGQQQLQTGQQEIQMRQQSMDATKKLNDAYAYPGVFTTDAQGNPPFNPNLLTQRLAANKAGSQIPAVLKGAQEFQKQPVAL